MTKAFSNGLCLFEHFDLDVPAGQVLAVVGPSGSGKTTLLNLIALVDWPQAGEIRLCGDAVTMADVGRIPIGYIFQTDALLPWSTALENVLLGVHCRRRRGDRALVNLDCAAERAAALAMLAAVGLAGHERSYPHMLSGGQRQRVALAQNLLFGPRLLLLDEPTASLDFQTKLKLEGVLKRSFRHEFDDGARRTTVFVTHDIDQALALADRVIVLSRVGVGPARIVYDTPGALDRDVDPALLRHDTALQGKFQEIWQQLKAHAPD